MLCGGRPARVRSSTCATASRPTSGVNVSSRQAGRPTGDPGRRRDAREQEGQLDGRGAAADHHDVPVGEVLGEPEVVRVQLPPAEPAATGVGGPERLLPRAGRVDQPARPPDDGLVGAARRCGSGPGAGRRRPTRRARRGRAAGRAARTRPRTARSSTGRRRPRARRGPRTTRGIPGSSCTPCASAMVRPGHRCCHAPPACGCVVEHDERRRRPFPAALADRDEARAPQVVGRGQPGLSRADHDHRHVDRARRLRRPSRPPRPAGVLRAVVVQRGVPRGIHRPPTYPLTRPEPLRRGPRPWWDGAMLDDVSAQVILSATAGPLPAGRRRRRARPRGPGGGRRRRASPLGAAAAVAQRRGGAGDPPARDGRRATSSATPSSTSGTQTSTKAELVVDPAHRRAGVGRALLTRALAETAVVPGRTLRVWAHGDLPAARRVRRGRRAWPSCASCCRCASTSTAPADEHARPADGRHGAGVRAGARRGRVAPRELPRVRAPPGAGPDDVGGPARPGGRSRGSTRRASCSRSATGSCWARCGPRCTPRGEHGDRNRSARSTWSGWTRTRRDWAWGAP